MHKWAVSSIGAVAVISGWLLFAAPGFAKAKSELRHADQLADFVKANGIRSVEDFLENLPDRYKVADSGYVLIKNSESLQYSDPLNPRAILFGRDAKLIFTFNGTQSRPSWNTIEFIQADEKSGTSQPGKILFNPDQNGLPTILY